MEKTVIVEYKKYWINIQGCLKLQVKLYNKQRVTATDGNGKLKTEKYKLVILRSK